MSKTKSPMMLLFAETLRRLGEMHRPVVVFANILERIKPVIVAMPFDEAVAAQLRNLNEILRHSGAIESSAVMARAIEIGEALEREVRNRVEGKK
jgi:hypothetical protein